MSDMASIKAGEAYIAISVDDKNLAQTLRESSAKLHAWCDSTDKKLAQWSGSLFNYFTGATKVFAAHTAALTGMAAPFAALGDNLDKMAGRTGMSTQFLSEFDHVANLCGSSLSAVEMAVKKVQENMLAASRGNKEVIASLTDVGLSYESLRKQSPERQFMSIVSALADCDDKTRQAGLAMKLFGEQGRSLMNVIASGSDSIQAMRDEANALGVTLDSGAAAQAAKLTDSLYQLKQSAVGISLAFGKSVAPVLIESLDSLKGWVVYGRQFVAAGTTFSRMFVSWSTGCVKMSAGLMGLYGVLSVGTKVLQMYCYTMNVVAGYTAAMYKTLASGLSSVTTWIAMIRQLSTAYDTLGTAANMLLTALRLPIDARANQVAAGLVLMSNAEAGAAARAMLAAKWQQLCELAGTLVARLTSVAMATTGLSLAERIAAVRIQAVTVATALYTAAKTRLLAVTSALRGLTLASIAAFMRDAVVKVASSVATLVLGVATKGLAGAYLVLAAAMNVVAAHPVGIALIAIGAIIAGLVIGLREATLYTAKLSDEQTKLADSELAKRQADANKFDLLKTLAGKGELTDKEHERAKQLLSELRGKYGDIGMAIDENTKRISAGTDAQEKFNAAVRKQAAERLKAQIAEEESNLKEIEKENEGNSAWREGWGGQLTGRLRDTAAYLSFCYVDGIAQKWEADVNKEFEKKHEQMKKLVALRKKLGAIEGGDTNQALGDDEQAALQKEIAAAAEQGQKKEEIAKRIADLDAEIAKSERARAREEMSETERRIDDYNRETDALKNILLERHALENAKPIAEQDAALITSLEEQRKKIDEAQKAFADKVRAEEAAKIESDRAKKEQDAKNSVTELEKRWRDEDRSETQKRIDAMDEENEAYKKQIHAVRDLIAAKKELTEADTAAIAVIDQKLADADKNAEDRKNRLLTKDVDRVNMPVLDLRRQYGEALLSGNQGMAAQIGRQIEQVQNGQSRDQVAKLGEELKKAIRELKDAQKQGLPDQVAAALKRINDIEGDYNSALDSLSGESPIEKAGAEVQQGQQQLKFASEGSFNAREAIDKALGGDREDTDKKILQSSRQQTDYQKRMADAIEHMNGGFA